MIGKPFVKWAGGKAQLLEQIKSRYPVELGGAIKKYCEPFVGGGAVLFDILSNYNIEEVLINDINKELINTYTQIKDNVNEILELLSSMQDHYLPLDTESRKKFYYDKRNKFNELKIKGDKKDDLEIATLFIFLNRTCFNGLFRVNKRGLFNVPIGSYKNPTICDSENLKIVSKLLQKVIIKNGDYTDCKEFIDENTFVYIDPPYRPLTKTSNFTSYDEKTFDDYEQVKLGEFVGIISNKGAKVMLSNSDPKNIDEDDNFFDDIYRKYNISRVEAKRMINSKSENRGIIHELLITNY